MSIHSLALRERVVRAIEKKRGNIDEIADLFEVSRSSGWRWLRLRQETGKVEARPRGGGKASTVVLDRIRALPLWKRNRRGGPLKSLQHITGSCPSLEGFIARAFNGPALDVGMSSKKNVPSRQSTTDLRFAKRDSDSRHG